MKYLYVLVICMLSISCTVHKKIIQNPNDFFVALQKQKYSDRKIGNRFIKMYKEERRKIYSELDFIDYTKDTLFIMQRVNIESWTFHESIWNTKGKVEYNVFGKELNINPKYEAFEKEYYSLVNRWATDSIRYYEKKYSNRTHVPTITAIKVIITKGKLNVECINFLGFSFPPFE